MTRGRLITILTLLALGLGVVLWNQRRPGGEVIDARDGARWQRSFRYKTPSFANPLGGPDIIVSAPGVSVLKDVIRESRPVRNPIRIVREHVRYWANSRLFAVEIWMNRDSSEGWVTYYQHDKYVFLRHANPWQNAVRTTDHSVEALEAILLPFVNTVGPVDPNAPAEVEPKRP